MTDLISAYVSPDEHVIVLPLEKITCDENIDEEYAKSLSELRVDEFTPIIVIKHPRKHLYAVLDGHHRFRATKIKGLRTIRAVVVDDYTGLGFDLTKEGLFQPTKEMTKYIRVPLKRFSEEMRRFFLE
jgi:hypothetical protein